MKRFGKKNRKVFFTLKILAIFYLSILTISYMNGKTGAYFSATSQLTGEIKIATWETSSEQWDKSSFEFPNKDQDQQIESCNSINLSVAILNTGNEMQGPSQYEVYYIAKGNPKDGKMVGGGTIDPLGSNHTGALNFTAELPGNYKVKAYQRPYHNFESTRKELWSETITVTCPKTTNTNQDDESITKNNEDIME